MDKIFSYKRFKIFFFIILLLIIFYRSPHILLHGRFVAEEGSFWFRNSYLFGPLKGLFQVYWASSYFNLWPNVASVIASMVPLEYSPLVTVYFALSVKIYLFIYILYSKSSFLINNFDKAVVSLLILLTPPMVPEVWLNTLTSQVYFTILSVLIFFQSDGKKNLFYKISPIILCISGMCSVLVCALSPFFLIKFLKEKSKNNFYNLIFISTTTIFQSIIFLYSKFQNLDLAGDYSRFILSLDKIVNFTYNVIVKTFFGRELTQFLYFNFLKNINIYIISLIIIISILYILILTIKKNYKDKILIYLFLFFITLSFISLVGSKSDQVQGRYAVVPGFILLLMTYRLCQIYSNALKKFFFSLILISLITGSYEFKTNNKYSKFLICYKSKGCPDWKLEVDKWMENKSYMLKIWTYPEDKMSLDK